LVKPVTHQVVDRWPSHVAGRLWSSASTDLQLGIPFYRLLERVIVKTTRERLKGGAGRPATPWARWSAAFAHWLLVSGTPSE
jgi:hypothetical protein